MGVVVERAEGDVGVCSFCFVFGLVWHVRDRKYNLLGRCLHNMILGPLNETRTEKCAFSIVAVVNCHMIQMR